MELSPKKLLNNIIHLHREDVVIQLISFTCWLNKVKCLIIDGINIKRVLDGPFSLAMLLAQWQLRSSWSHHAHMPLLRLLWDCWTRPCHTCLLGRPLRNNLSECRLTSTFLSLLKLAKELKYFRVGREESRDSCPTKENTITKERAKNNKF